MSRTTKALKRLGVPGLVAATIIAGAPAFVATAASAATGDTISISPTADSASAGTCNPFTVTVKNAAGQPATSTVDVVITQRNNGAATAADSFDVNFCATNTTTPNQMPTNAGSTGTPTGGVGTNADTDTRRGEFTPDAKGQFTFGVIGTEPGVADIVAYLDNNNSNTIDSGENYATAVKTFTAGTAADVRTITASPKTATNFVGEQHTISATLKNGAGDTVAGITPIADVTSGPNAAVTPTCTASDNDGVSKCTYTGGTVGTDTIVVYINQTNADNNPSTPDTTGADAGEPQDTVQKTWQTAPTGLTIDVTCGDSTTARSGPEDCFNQVSDTTETFSALVKKADGSVASGVIVSFAITADSDAANAKPTLSAAEATTNASGIATVTLTNTKPSENEQITVVGTVRGQTPTTSDDARKTWRTATTGERNVTLTPESATTTVNTFRTYTAHVVNVNGEPVSGVTVRFDETGAGAFRNGSSQVFTSTDVNGNATVEVTAGASEAGSSQTITATIFSAECAKAAGDPAGSTAGNCTDSSTNNWVTAASPSSAPPSTPPGCTTAAGQNPNLQVRVNTPTINATGLASVTVTGAVPGQVIELQGYSQNHYGTANFNNDPTPIDRTAVADSNGSATFNDLRPASNTRVRARQRGCAFGNIGAVINVRAQETLQVTRNGVRTYTFSGQSIPARPGGLIVNLYRIVGAACAAGVEPRNCPGEVLIGQDRANPGTDSGAQPAGAGLYSIRITFPARDAGTRDEFVVKTGQDAQNAPGRSNTRSLAIF